MKRFLLLFMIAALILSATAEITFAAAAAFTLNLSGPTEYQSGQNINVVITVNNITLTGGMSYVSFRLYYNPDKVIPVIKNGFTSESENRSTFITKCPSAESWEVVGILDETQGFYELTFGTDDVFFTKLAKSDGDLVFTIPFKIMNEAEGDIAFTAPDEYAEGGNSDLSEMEVPGEANDLLIKKYIPAAYTEGVNNISDATQVTANKTLSVLSDRNAASSLQNYNDESVVLFENKMISEEYPEVGLVLMLDQATEFNKVTLNFYHEYDYKIGLPEGNKITVSYASAPESFTKAGEYYFSGKAETGTRGVLCAELELGQTFSAIYIKVTFSYGPSSGNYIGLTEFGVSKISAPVIPELKPGTGAEISGEYLFGIREEATISGIQAMFTGSVAVSGTGTGSTVAVGNKTLIIIVKGDINGDGKINATDYLYVKRSCLGLTTLSTVQAKAACFENTANPTAKDYLIIKRHFLGTYNIFG